MGDQLMGRTTLPALHQLADEYLEAFRTLSELEFDDQTVADTLEAIRYPIEQKGAAIAQMARNFEALAEQIRAAEAVMAARRYALEKRANKVREYLKANMERAGITKLDCPYFTISIKKNPEAAVIDAENEIPAEYLRIPPIPLPTVDKAAVKAALKDGKLVPGARLVQGTRIEVK